MSRYGRQIRLAEVGVEGQAKLEAATVGLAMEGHARAVEASYLLAAGLQLETERWQRSVPDLGLRHAAAIEVAEGAYSALITIRQTLELP